MVGVGAEEEIDETRAGDFDAHNLVFRADGRHQAFGQLARLAARLPGQRHCQVAGEVAMRALARALHDNGGSDVCRQVTVFLQSGDGAVEYLCNLFFHGWRTVMNVSISDK